jgi:sugar lactone lactonase YvrE
MNKSKLLVLLAFLFSTFMEAQTDLAIGDWKALFPHKGGRSVTQSPNTVYYSTELGIVGFDKIERSHRILTKVEGLSSAEFAKLLYHEGSQNLVAVYNSGVIDIISSEGVTTMKDIANFDNVPIDRRANFLWGLDENTMLLAAEYGLSRVDVVSKKVLWTCFTVGNPVNAAVRWKGYYYAATDEGLYRVPVDGLVENFDIWEKLGDDWGLPENDGFDALGIFDRWLVAGSGPLVFITEDTLFDTLHYAQGFEARFIKGGRQYVLINYYCGDNCDSKVVAYNANLEFTESSPGCVNRTFESLEDERGFIWYADQFDNFRVAPGNGTQCQFLAINGPFTKNVNDIEVGQDEVVVASGGTINGFFYSFRNDGFFVLDKSGEWTSHNLFNTQELRDRDLKNFHAIAIHPATGDQYHATYWGGVVVYKKDGTYEFYDENNSTLRKKDAGDPRERCTDLEFDNENNLWVTTLLAPENGLSVLKNDGTWQGFNPPNFGQGPNMIAIDQNGYKWITLAADASRGVYVFDEGELNDPNDDRGYVFTRNNSELPSNNAWSVKVDLDGDVWVGTDQGAVVFECGQNIFQGECRGSRRKVEQDSIIAFLLETEEVRAIEVDGANRKWFGTRNGVYVQSPSGEEQVFAFNEENSPLPDNVVNDIAIDPENGTAYIGTDKGIIAYRTDAIEGGRNHKSEVFAYPNPVRPGYQGPIAIKGLPRDAQVKITDVSGFLVYETEALGGQAVWDGMDYNGRRAASGIYLVFSTSEGSDFEAPEALVTKILIMN